MSKPSERRQRCIRRLLGLQGGKCFCCQQAISEADQGSRMKLSPREAVAYSRHSKRPSFV